MQSLPCRYWRIDWNIQENFGDLALLAVNSVYNLWLSHYNLNRKYLVGGIQ